MSRIEELQRRREEVHAALQRLDNQAKMLDVLLRVQQSGWEDQPLVARASALADQLMATIVVNCERIWELSGPARLGREGKKGDQEGGRDETLPW